MPIAEGNSIDVFGCPHVPLHPTLGYAVGGHLQLGSWVLILALPPAGLAFFYSFIRWTVLAPPAHSVPALAPFSFAFLSLSPFSFGPHHHGNES